MPLNEALEQYEIEFLDASFTTVLGTFSSNTPSLTLNNSELTAMYGVLPTQFNFRVYQISATVGRGIPMEVQQKPITASR